MLYVIAVIAITYHHRYIYVPKQGAMKRFILFFWVTPILFSCGKKEEQLPVVFDTDFNIVYGSIALEQVHAAARSLDGGYMLVGAIKSKSGVAGNTDALMLKIDKQGKMMWQKTFGGSDYEAAYAVASTKDGGYVLAGYTNSNDGDLFGNHGNADAWVIKLDKDGRKGWQKILGGSSNDFAFSIVEISDGSYIMAGQTDSNDGDVNYNHGNKDVWIVKLDKNGNKLWQKTFGGTGSEGASSIIETLNEEYVMAGWTNSNDGDVTGYHTGSGMLVGSIDGWMIKLDKDGNLLWNKALGGSNNDVINSIVQGVNNSYTIAGYTKSKFSGDVGVNHGNEDAWVMNLDRDGEIVWRKTLGGSNGDLANFITATADSGYILLATTSSNDGDVRGNHGSEDAWAVKLDKGGNNQWQRVLGGSNNDIAQVIFQRTDGSYVVIGATGSNDGDLIGQQSSGGIWVFTVKGQ